MANSEVPFSLERSAGARLINRYARIGGTLILVSFIAGLFGEVYVPSLVTAPAGSAAAAHDLLFLRAGFASYLVEALCDVTLTLILYVILRPVKRNLALLATFFRLVSTAAFAAAEFFYLAALLVVQHGSGYLKAFSPDQINAATQFSLELYGFGGSTAGMFYGAAAVVIGYLIYRSVFLPRLLGGLWVLGGLGQIVNIFALTLAPAYAFFWELLPLLLAMLILAAWFLVRGIDSVRWSECATDQTTFV